MSSTNINSSASMSEKNTERVNNWYIKRDSQLLYYKEDPLIAYLQTIPKGDDLEQLIHLISELRECRRECKKTWKLTDFKIEIIMRLFNILKESSTEDDCFMFHFSYCGSNTFEVSVLWSTYSHNTDKLIFDEFLFPKAIYGVDRKTLTF